MGSEIDLGIEGLTDYEEIGAGGFAVVYSATEAGIGRRVAVKVLTAIDEAGRRRFDRESRTMGLTTEHPNIVTLFRSGYSTVDNRPFLIMEYVSGGSLQDRVDERPVPWGEAIELVLPVADALGYSHNAGILHKDIKPANILLSRTEALSRRPVVKLSDFGIAGIREATATSQVAFSMLYAPPETFTSAGARDPDGRPIDPRDERSDLYSLAATLYTLGTGAPPFQSGSHPGLMHEIINAPAPETGIAQLDELFAKTLAKDPAERHQTAAEFYTALEALPLRGVQAPRPLPPRAKPVQPIAPQRATSGSRPAPSSEAETQLDRSPQRPVPATSDSGTPTRAASSPARLIIALVAFAAIAAGIVWLRPETEDNPPQDAEAPAEDGADIVAEADEPAESESMADRAPEVGVDHWHDAYLVHSCGIDLPPSTITDDPDGIHTHGRGLIHIHPFNLASAGPNATLGVFIDAIGAELTDDTYTPGPGEDPTVLSEEAGCDGEPATLQLAYWADAWSDDEPQIITENLTDFQLTDEFSGAVTLALLPEGAEIPKPPQDRLDVLDATGVLAAIDDNADWEATTTTAPQPEESAVSAPVAGGAIDGEAECPASDGSSRRITSFAQAPPTCIDETATYTAEIDTTLGRITVDLNAAAAPTTVNNFVFLARYHYYDGSPFHRIIPGFVIQGGDATGNPLGTGNPGYFIPEEPPEPGEYQVGSLAMAKGQGEQTTGGQFFIVTGSQGVNLPNEYSLFGTVLEGMDVVFEIEGLPTNAQDYPTEEIYINSITITEN